MPVETSPSASPVFDPQSWVDLLTVHALQGDLFSVGTLSVIHEGVEKLTRAREAVSSPIVLTGLHAALFERLRQSFNNPGLLKDAGDAYLNDFGLPEVALKHYEAAAQFSPKDKVLEEALVTAALVAARQRTDPVTHTGLDEVAAPGPGVDALVRRTSKLANVVETRNELSATAGELTLVQQKARKTRPLAVPTDFQTLLGRVPGLIAQGNFAEATQALSHAAKVGAPGEELQAFYAQLGLTAYDQGRMQEALDAFLPMRALAPTAVEGWFNCGLVYQKMGRLEKALDCYREAARIAPNNSKIWCNLSSVQFELGSPAEAERAARQALALKPDYARAWDNLASALTTMNRLGDAAEACQQAFRIQPALHSAWFKFGVIQFQLDNLRVAEEAFNVISSDSDFHVFALYYLCMIRARNGQMEEALHLLEQARTSDPANELDSGAVRELAGGFTKAGKHAVAADWYRQVTDQHPEDFSAWLALGTAHHRASQIEPAQRAYLRATELKPDSPLPWHNLGMLAADHKQHELACSYFQREVEISPDDAKAWYDLGVSLRTLGREEESATAFTQAEVLVKALARNSSDLSAALSIVRRLNLGGRVIKTE